MATPFVDAAGEGNLQEVTRLLDTGVDINQRDQLGRTALFWASCRGYSEIVTLLLDRGASIDLPNNDGYTALMIVIYSGFPNIASLLLERGANPSIKDKNGQTALDMARENNEDIAAIIQNHEAQESVAMPRMVNK